MPTASRLLRLLGFAVPSALLLAGVQPIMGAATGSIGPLWAAKLAHGAKRYDCVVVDLSLGGARIYLAQPIGQGDLVTLTLDRMGALRAAHERAEAVLERVGLQDRREVAPDGRDRQQDDGGERHPGEHQHRGVELPDGDLDQQVRDAPAHAKQGEQDETASCHPTMVPSADSLCLSRLFS